MNNAFSLTYHNLQKKIYNFVCQRTFQHNNLEFYLTAAEGVPTFWGDSHAFQSRLDGLSDAP